jgi:DNA repair protein RadA/Sms
MAKNETVWVCTTPNCGQEYAKYIVRCHKCDEFSTIVERTVGASVEKAGLKSGSAIAPASPAKPLPEWGANSVKRIPSGIGELDRVLSGGFVEGQVILLGGEPGAGKSTLCLQIAAAAARTGHKVLYSSGEESEAQIKLRADRLQIDDRNILVTHETVLESLLGQIEESEPTFMIVDSLQAIASLQLEGGSGGISQSVEAASTLTRVAKSKKIVAILINQVLKSGDPAGSKQIQHAVDTIMMFESDHDSPLKFLRAHKNRFGDASEVGIFQHAETGLEEVGDPSGVLLDSGERVPGEAVGFISQGIRQIPVEIQSLIATSTLNNPRKQFSTVDNGRGQIICAILDKFAGANLAISDVFVSTVAGLRVNDPLCDLAVAASLLSAEKGVQSSSPTAFIGEMSLTGKVRGSMIEQRVKEASRLGFERVVIARSSKLSKRASEGVDVVRIETISELLRAIQG